MILATAMIAEIVDSYETLTIPNATNVASAAKHHKKHVKKHKKHVTKKHAKKHVAKKKATISANSSNNATNSQNNSTNTSLINNNSEIDGIKPQSDYKTLGDWYLNNDKALYKNYMNDSYFNASEDASGLSNGGPSMNPSKYDNAYYKMGWIITYVNGDEIEPTDNSIYGDTADNYNKAIQIYEDGVNYIKQNKITDTINYNNVLNSWSTN